MSFHDLLYSTSRYMNFNSFNIKRIRIDWFLLSLLLVLCGFGLCILYSASGKNIDVVVRQSLYMLIGFIGMLLIAQVSPRAIARFSFGLYFLGIVLLLSVLVFGVESKGAQRWIQLPFFRFQPSELIKLIMPIVIANFLSQKCLPPNLKDIFFALVIVGVPVFLIAKQPDLGTALLVAASGLFALLLSGVRKRYILFSALLAIPSCLIFWQYFMREYQKKRVLTFLHPENDTWGAGWNIIQSKIAIGSGGLYGKGWLHGTQSHLNFLPESHTDFILAVLAEEFGLLGCVALLSLYFVIVVRGLYIAYQSPMLLGKLLAGSMILTFFVYIFVNVGMVSGVLPVVGVPLPLISRGGTSIVTLMLGFGLLMSIYTHKSLHSRLH